jgi:hypothetical protein
MFICLWASLRELWTFSSSVGAEQSIVSSGLALPNETKQGNSFTKILHVPRDVKKLPHSLELNHRMSLRADSEVNETNKDRHQSAKREVFGCRRLAGI